MDPLRTLPSKWKERLARLGQGLSDGWRDLLLRSSDSLTRFVRVARPLNLASEDDQPQWALMPGEVWETALAVIVRIEMPGVRHDDIEVRVDHGRLHIRGVKRSAEDSPARYRLMERAFGRFERTLCVPPTVDPTQPEFSLQDGVMTVILAKIQEGPPSSAD